jgi:CheY-like chemotaxis protein
VRYVYFVSPPIANNNRLKVRAVGGKRYIRVVPVVLHIDNSEDEIFFFRRAFDKSALAWSLESLEGGQEALEYLEDAQGGREQKPGLVLVDLKMPIVDGFRVLEWLQAQMPQVPAAVVSSSELKADKERARDLGAVAYFRKEQNFEEVLGYMRDLAA